MTEDELREIEQRNAHPGYIAWPLSVAEQDVLVLAFEVRRLQDELATYAPDIPELRGELLAYIRGYLKRKGWEQMAREGVREG